MVPALRSTRVPPIAALHAFTPPRAAAAGSSTSSSSVLLGLGRPGDGPDRAVRQRRGRHRGWPDRRRRGRDRPRRSRSSARAWCRRWRLSPAGRWSGPARLTGRLARENSQRNPSRTAVTAAALMIGLALVTFVTVFAAGLKSSVAQVIDENFAGGLVIQNTDGFSPIPTAAAAAARKVPGVELVATIRSAAGEAASARAHGRGSPLRLPTSATRSKSNGRRVGPDPAQPRATARRSSPILRLRTRPRSRRPLPPAQPDRRRPSLPGRRRVLLEARTCSAASSITQPVLARDFAPDPGHDRLRQDRAGREPGHVQALLTETASKPRSRPPKCSTSRN